MDIKIFADGADLNSIVEHAGNPIIRGFTTNPTLVVQAGVADYKTFVLKAAASVGDKPISFEVFADELDEMLSEGLVLHSWAPKADIKIPIQNTKGVSTIPVIKKLMSRGIRVNVTAMFTTGHVDDLVNELSETDKAILSIFAGRIADTGVDPAATVSHAIRSVKGNENVEVLWASPREPFNIYQADALGCDIITVVPSMIEKFLGQRGKNLDEFSLETVKMFFEDAQSSGLSIA